MLVISVGDSVIPCHLSHRRWPSRAVLNAQVQGSKKPHYWHGRTQTQRWTTSHDACRGDVNLSRATQEERQRSSTPSVHLSIIWLPFGPETKRTKQFSSVLEALISELGQVQVLVFFPLYFIIKLSICENFPLKSTLTPYEDKQLWRLVT